MLGFVRHPTAGISIAATASRLDPHTPHNRPEPRPDQKHNDDQPTHAEAQVSPPGTGDRLRLNCHVGLVNMAARVAMLTSVYPPPRHLAMRQERFQVDRMGTN